MKTENIFGLPHLLALCGLFVCHNAFAFYNSSTGRRRSRACGGAADASLEKREIILTNESWKGLSGRYAERGEEPMKSGPPAFPA